MRDRKRPPHLVPSEPSEWKTQLFALLGERVTVDDLWNYVPGDPGAAGHVAAYEAILREGVRRAAKAHMLG